MKEKNERGSYQMDYEAVIRRLAAYRRANHLRQTEMAAQLHMTQGQYSKLEGGRIKISYDNLCTLGQRGCDIDELITGKGRQELLPCLHALTFVEDERHLTNLLRLCEWTWEEWAKDTNVTDEIGCRLLRLWISLDWQSKPQWVRLRKAHHEISQINMANAIGVNIKKYRLLERGNVRPDAELMLNIYELTQCPPAFFMDERGYYLSLINDACKGDEAKEQRLEEVLQFVEQMDK